MTAAARTTGTGAVEAVERIVNRGGNPEDVLRQIVAALVERGGCTSARVSLTGKPFAAEAGERGEPSVRIPIRLEGQLVAELEASGCENDAQLSRIALLASTYCRSGSSQ